MSINETRTYRSTEQVRARQLSEDGEEILTSTLGGITVFGGYLVHWPGGRTEYRTTEMFEAHYDPIKDLPDGLVLSEDGELLNWRGENYIRAGAEEPPAEKPRKSKAS